MGASADLDHLDQDATVIDLRDPSVAGGLADALTQVMDLSERTGAAETKAELATQERLTAMGQVRRLNDELDTVQGECHRLEIDNAELRSENAVRTEQLEAAHREMARTCDELAEILASRDATIDWLRSELEEARRSVHTLEALVSRRARRTYQRICVEEDQSQQTAGN